MTKRLLFTVTRAPRDGALANETLDAILVAAAFDLRPNVLVMGDGVWQLVPASRPEALGTRDVARAFAALPTYDVERVYVERAALAARGLALTDLSVPAEALDGAGIRALIADHDAVLSG